MHKEQKEILRLVEAGKISSEEALKLLEALDQAGPPDEPNQPIQPTNPPTQSTQPTILETPPTDVPDAENLWLYPVIAGAVVMAVGAPLMAMGFMGEAALFWALFCGWIPFFIGLFILTLGVWSRDARWFHLRISDARSGRRRFVLSLPLPLTLTVWILRVAKPFVPPLKETGADEAILALRQGLEERDGDEPFVVDVQDDEDGERVQIYVA